MPSDVNPFEPWRPRGASDDDVVHPWPVPGPAERDDGEDREIPHYERRAGRSERDEPADPRRSPSVANGLLVLLFLVLLLGGLGSLGSSGGGHVWRIATVCTTLFLGPLIGLSMMHRSPWYTRLGVCAAACLVALACYYFVPTTGGVNLWMANARVANLDRIPPGDFDAFTAARPGIAEVRREFRALEIEIVQAEARREGRSLHEALGRIARGRAADPEGTIDLLDKLQSEMRRFGFQPGGRAGFRDAVSETWDAVLQRLERESSELAGRGQFVQAQQLLAEKGKSLVDKVGWALDKDGRIKGMQRAVLKRHLEEGKKLLARLMKEGKWDEATREGRRLNADLLDAAAPIGQADAVRGVIDGPRRDAVRGRLAAAEAAALKKIEAGDFDEADRIARQAVAAVSDEARVLRLGNGEEGFLAVRRQALRARIDHAGRALQGLIDKKDYARVAADGAEARGKLIDVARELAQERYLDDAIGAARRKALAARLDAAREEFTALLVKDRYEEIGKAAARAEVALGPEAEALGRREELEAFASRCRVFARLGALAGKK